MAIGIDGVDRAVGVAEQVGPGDDGAVGHERAKALVVGGRPAAALQNASAVGGVERVVLIADRHRAAELVEAETRGVPEIEPERAARGQADGPGLADTGTGARNHAHRVLVALDHRAARPVDVGRHGAGLGATVEERRPGEVRRPSWLRVRWLRVVGDVPVHNVESQGVLTGRRRRSHGE